MLALNIPYYKVLCEGIDRKKVKMLYINTIVDLPRFDNTPDSALHFSQGVE